MNHVIFSDEREMVMRGEMRGHDFYFYFLKDEMDDECDD